MLHITYSLGFGGVESQLATIAKTSGSTFEHRFCALVGGGFAEKEIAAAGKRVDVLALEPWRHPVSALWRLARYLRRVRPDVVHAHGLEANLFGVTAALLAGVRVRIAEEIGMPDHSLRQRLVLRCIYGGSARVIAVSRSVQEAVVASGEAPERKVISLHNPVQLSPLRAAVRDADEPLRIGFVGRLEPVKGARELVQAMALLPNDLSCELRLIGDGTDRVGIEALIAGERLAGRVVLAGFVPRPAELLASCHLYVQPSHSEGLGIALIEAMSCGLPAIVTRRGGMPEVVEHGVSGWILGSPEPAAIAAAIAEAAALPPARLAKMGEAAREAVQQRFDPKQYLDRIEALYATLLR